MEAQIFRRAPSEENVLVPAVAEPLLVWVMSGEAKVEERELNGEWRGGNVASGSFYLTQTEAPYLMRWQASLDTPFEVMHLYLGFDLVSRTARSLGLNPARLRMRDVSDGRDTLISGLLTGLADELQTEQPASALFVKGLVESLTIYLLRNYADVQAASRRKPAKLPAWKLRKVLDHMDEFLAEPFDLNQLAAICAMSRFHFSRAFHNTVGQNPSSWFIRRRAERAKKMLLETDMPIINIALAVGYDSPSHFAHVFRRETGVSPREYRSM
ncbi:MULTISPECIES: helix-turn-helix domain-containing protein [unclassified Brenneria]|uniref:helix-turn-helix domain-containing protein n=1 Tax=unclassified Brenneria TaxID=2634434 RepID=UPI0018F0EA94|nr:helix-turn-helix transcriptional regulator [Brenneria sp. L3-3C-1]MEE3645211.1 AraC family transcriptional regulator [Brenneria sp. L3_3C_1]